MKPLHTIRLTHTPTSVTIELAPPAMTIEVRVTLSNKRHHVQVFRPNSRGTMMQAGEFGWYGSPERAMEVALEVAHVLAVGLGICALRGDVVKPEGKCAHPRTHELVEQAEAAIARVARIFAKSTPGDLQV